MKNINLINFISLCSVLFLSACGGTSPLRQTQHWGGATLHAIILADTNDTSIGKSAEVDLQKMGGWVESISGHTGLKTRKYYLSGNNFTYHNITTTLNELSIMGNDVVIFYYAGHGKNPETKTRWPSMSIEENFLDFKSVVNTLESKNPRLFLAFADTCNGFSNDRFYFSQPRTSARGMERTENYRQLFLNAQGYVIASGAKPGQLSWSNSKDGGFFTNQFLWNLETELASRSKPSWTAIIKRTKRPINVPSGDLQEPQYKVNIVGETSLVTTPAIGHDNDLDGENDLEFQWLFEKPQHPSQNESDDTIWH